MTDPAIIEAAARAIANAFNEMEGDRFWERASDDTRKFYRDLIARTLPAVTPIIEAAALERAAKVADSFACGLCGHDGMAGATIRALKPDTMEKT